MSHETEIVKVEKLDNGQFVISIRCCGRAKVYPHTVSAAVMADPERKLQSVADARARAAQEHENESLAEMAIPDLVGQVVKHE